MTAKSIFSTNVLGLCLMTALSAASARADTPACADLGGDYEGTIAGVVYQLAIQQTDCKSLTTVTCPKGQDFTTCVTNTYENGVTKLTATATISDAAVAILAGKRAVINQVFTIPTAPDFTSQITEVLEKTAAGDLSRVVYTTDLAKAGKRTVEKTMFKAVQF